MRRRRRRRVNCRQADNFSTLFLSVNGIVHGVGGGRRSAERLECNDQLINKSAFLSKNNFVVRSEYRDIY